MLSPHNTTMHKGRRISGERNQTVMRNKMTGTGRYDNATWNTMGHYPEAWRAFRM